MIPRNLTWLRQKTCGIIGIDPTEIDAAFRGPVGAEFTNIDSFIQEALDMELEEMFESADPTRGLEYQYISWPVNQVRITLPAPLDTASLVRIEDETHFTPGDMVRVAARSGPFVPDVWWYDKRTLQWGVTGPYETKNLRVSYMSCGAQLVNPDDEPTDIPYRYRWVLPWSAAIISRTSRQEDAPAAWVRQYKLWHDRLLMTMFNGRPSDSNPPRQQPSGSEESEM